MTPTPTAVIRPLYSCARLLWSGVVFHEAGTRRPIPAPGGRESRNMAWRSRCTCSACTRGRDLTASRSPSIDDAVFFPPKLPPAARRGLGVSDCCNVFHQAIDLRWPTTVPKAATFCPGSHDVVTHVQPSRAGLLCHRLFVAGVTRTAMDFAMPAGGRLGLGNRDRSCELRLQLACCPNVASVAVHFSACLLRVPETGLLPSVLPWQMAQRLRRLPSISPRDHCPPSRRKQHGAAGRNCLL